MKQLNNKSRFWFWAIKTIYAKGGERERNIIAPQKAIAMTYCEDENTVDIFGDNGKCSVYIPCFDIRQCVIVG